MARLWRRKRLTIWSVGYVCLQSAGGLCIAGLILSAVLVAAGALVLMLVADAGPARRGSGSRMTHLADSGRPS